MLKGVPFLAKKKDILIVFFTSFNQIKIIVLQCKHSISIIWYNEVILLFSPFLPLVTKKNELCFHSFIFFRKPFLHVSDIILSKTTFTNIRIIL